MSKRPTPITPTSERRVDASAPAQRPRLGGEGELATPHPLAQLERIFGRVGDGALRREQALLVVGPHPRILATVELAARHRALRVHRAAVTGAIEVTAS